MAEQNDLIRVHTCQRESVLQSLTEDRTSACWMDRFLYKDIATRINILSIEFVFQQVSSEVMIVC